jgi:RimJ/RimL family protein N-acetyltransferase
MQGRCCRLEPLDPQRHAPALFAAHAEDRDGRNWTYLPYGPFASEVDFTRWARGYAETADPSFYAIVEATTQRALGAAAYLRIDPEIGSIEVGHLCFAPALQRTTASTEAMYLMMRHVFDELGYRRYEWKCDSLNAPSRAAAERLGFRFEGTFRNATVTRGRSRDTSWFSITDLEWPAIRAALEGIDRARAIECAIDRLRS